MLLQNFDTFLPDYTTSHTRRLQTSINQQSRSRGANRSSADQEIPRILWHTQVHYRIHKSQPPVLILNQINPVHVPLSRLEIHFNIILPFKSRSSKWSLSFGFPHQSPVWTSFVSRTFYVTPNLILLEFVTRIIFGEQYRS